MRESWTFPLFQQCEQSLLDNRKICPGLIFNLYRVFLPSVQIRAFVPVGVTTRCKCPLTGTRRGLLLPTWYKCLTFVPGKKKNQYKCHSIDPTEGLRKNFHRCFSLLPSSPLILHHMFLFILISFSSHFSSLLCWRAPLPHRVEAGGRGRRGGRPGTASGRVRATPRGCGAGGLV
jgi:hypothetical protein